jgi:hypothetical protein
MAGGSSRMHMGDEDEVDLYGEPGHPILADRRALY